MTVRTDYRSTITEDPTHNTDGAACRGLDVDRLHFAEKDPPAIRAAKAVCAGCPVQAACLQYALDTRESWGVWGGHTAKEREAVLRRARKAKAARAAQEVAA